MCFPLMVVMFVSMGGGLSDGSFVMLAGFCEGVSTSYRRVANPEWEMEYAELLGGETLPAG